MKFYKVESRFYDSGKAKVQMNIIEAQTKPENKMKELERCDLYEDFFESEAEAVEFKNQKF